jgi:hypothetical protein
MNPEQQRIAIAEACGWRLFSQFKNLWAPPRSVVEYDCDARPLPNYLNDLNAMHEAEKVLTKVNWGGYAAELYRITDAHNHGISPNHHWLAVAFSTATQRAEAFLRTIGKWEESK